MVDPSGTFLYIANSGSGNISAYSIDSSSGALSAIAGSPFSSGTSPRSTTVDPSGKSRCRKSCVQQCLGLRDRPHDWRADTSSRLAICRWVGACGRHDRPCREVCLRGEFGIHGRLGFQYRFVFRCVDTDHWLAVSDRGWSGNRWTNRGSIRQVTLCCQFHLELRRGVGHQLERCTHSHSWLALCCRFTTAIRCD